MWLRSLVIAVAGWLCGGQQLWAQALLPVQNQPSPPTTMTTRNLRYRDIQHRAGDFGSAGGDAAERYKGRRVFTLMREAELSHDSGDYPASGKWRLQHFNFVASWQATPSLWMGLSGAQTKVVDQPEQKIVAMAAARYTEQWQSLAPSIVFKIMDALVLSYRLAATHLHWRSELGGKTLDRGLEQELAIRAKNETFEVAYYGRRYFGFEQLAALPDWGVEGRYHLRRNLSILMVYRRYPWQWQSLRLGTDVDQNISLGIIGQFDAWTMATQWRESGLGPNSNWRSTGLALAIDYEFDAAKSLGLVCEDWRRPWHARSRSAVELRSCGLRIGVEL